MFLVPHTGNMPFDHCSLAVLTGKQCVGEICPQSWQILAVCTLTVSLMTHAQCLLVVTHCLLTAAHLLC